MAGLYLHVPFCRQACHYCDFHFSTSLGNMAALVAAMCREIEIRASAGRNSTLETIYFGGGTPSLLSPQMLDRLFSVVHRNFNLMPGAEITLEANPDDISAENLRSWKSMGINRLSIGLQSSHNERLTWMNRSHNTKDGERAVKSAQDSGLENITVDLMYGFPGTDSKELDEDLAYILSLNTPHISAYSLTIEPETVFGRRAKKGDLVSLPDEEGAARFLQVFDFLEAAGFRGYEISNFAIPGSEAVHNRNYWLQKPFIGIGPAAHGFDGHDLRWENKPNNVAYMKALQAGVLAETPEKLSISGLANEFILTRLRMREGLPLQEFRQLFGMDLQHSKAETIGNAISQAWVLHEEDKLILTRSGRLLADHLAMELFTEDSDFA